MRAESDTVHPGVFLLARKPADFKARDLSLYDVTPVVAPRSLLQKIKGNMGPFYYLVRQILRAPSVKMGGIDGSRHGG
jgi:hypothetical protein